MTAASALPDYDSFRYRIPHSRPKESTILPVTSNGTVPSVSNGTMTDQSVDMGAGARPPPILDSDSSSTEQTTNPSTSSQQQLDEYREKLARDLERRELQARGLISAHSEKARISPIQEEFLSTPAWVSSNLNTSSTDSNHTIRGQYTPAAAVASTPSYPFPRMSTTAATTSTSNYITHSIRRQQSDSPTAAGAASRLTLSMPSDSRRAFDRVLSENSTPLSTDHFNTNGTPQHENPEFPTPDLYQLSLLLAAEPGLEPWWNTVVQIMRDIYKAERVTLSIPADATDIENVPWGQKATYNEHEVDDLSMGYIMKSASANIGSDADAVDSQATPDDMIPTIDESTTTRPGLLSRHSFTTYENKKKTQSSSRPAAAPRRPTYIGRPETSQPATPAIELPPSLSKLNKNTLEEHEAEDNQNGNIPSWEIPFRARYDGQGRVLPVLQALDYEADPLIDHAGVMRVLERGKPVALTRTYPYLPQTHSQDETLEPKSSLKRSISESSRKKSQLQRSDSATKLSAALAAGSRSRTLGNDKSKDTTTTNATTEKDAPRPSTPRYEEYEQALASPWSQSPAPSPAVRPDPQENPFFTDAMVDEGSFNPDAASTNYADMKPPEAIGLENSWTVLHIPLNHVLLSKSSRLLKHDAASMVRSPSQDMRNLLEGNKTRLVPTAILSVLSPLIPYPCTLRNSLEKLAPHLATTFSLCRHYTNLETELAGIQRRRPVTTGFGAVAPYGALPLGMEGTGLMSSLGGSITSPSDYSALSKSTTGSPLGTPSWETTFGSLADKRQPGGSPAAASQSGGGSYFSSRVSNSSMRNEVLSPGPQKFRSMSKDSSPVEKRSTRLPPNLKVALESEDSATETLDELTSVSTNEGKTLSSQGSYDLTTSTAQGSVRASTDRASEASSIERMQSYHEQSHSMLHSYGADFASTFQSLPPSSTLRSRPPPTPLLSGPSRSASVASAAADLPPPSDKLKGLILDSLPAHVFVALPQTGEIVWVNSRYLSYRGQSVTDLAADPWVSFHPDDRDEYLKDWGHSLRTGEQFSRTVRIRRFDGAYRWFYARAVASRDRRGVIMQFLGSYMDIHDQHIAELKAARQEEIEASETKHRLLANLIPQIIFTATEEDGITFANDQWLSYTGQSFEDSLGLGFMDFVHPDDLAKCRIPMGRYYRAHAKTAAEHGTTNKAPPPPPQDKQLDEKSIHFGSKSPKKRGSVDQQQQHPADMSALAKKGIVRITKDSNGRFSYASEVRLRTKAGEYRWHLIRCVEIDGFDFGRGASSYFGSATDINDHKLLEAKLKEAMESKGRFLSNMSHEIRTPLIGISGMVSFLQETVLNEEQRDYSNTIQTSASSLIMIINDILDLSKADAGMMKLKYEWFHTRSLIEDVNELVSTMSIAKGLELNYLVEADVPAWVKGDKVRIRQVLLNVIGNAIKFTDEGEVFSHCKVLKVDDGIGENSDSEIMLEFSITDTGRGFTQKEAELIFKPFSQIDGSSTRQHGGSGLGLVISRQLVELHGGTMSGTAMPGKGSTFTFTAMFALPSADDQPALPHSPGSTASVLSRRQSSEGSRFSPQLMATKRSSEAISPSDTRPFTISSQNERKTETLVAKASTRPPLNGPKASVNGVKSGLTQFSEAAKASGQDLSQMKLEIPGTQESPGRTTTPDNGSRFVPPAASAAPVYSILVVCPQRHSRDATVQHIEMTLPKDIPHQITAIGTIQEAHDLIGEEDPVTFTHIVINLGSAEAIISLMDEITQHQKMEKTMILILSDSVQRQAVHKVAAGTKYERLLSDSYVTFIYKPVKPSRFAVIFDPDKVRDLSTDLNRSSAQQMLENQKASSQELLRRMGNRGLRVLVVEDNKINQKVLTKYLEKIGVDVEIAEDGVECTETVLSKPHDYYSLILCDIQMPRKDGFETCQDIREWERAAGLPRIPIIALSANVMTVMQDRCAAVGFSDYVTKPVDFISLSKAMAQYF